MALTGVCFYHMTPQKRKETFFAKLKSLAQQIKNCSTISEILAEVASKKCSNY